ncbi:MAG: hypothetical protein V3T14_09285 [Myxococcota bacterium]
MVRNLAALALILALLPTVSAAGPYDPKEAGHPLRVVAYAAYPVGYVLERLIFFPAWLLGQREPFRTFFGVHGQPLRPHSTRPPRQAADPDSES